MGVTTIAIRDETNEALQVLADKAKDSQGDVAVSSSDVIDALLAISDELLSEDDVVAAIIGEAAQH